MTPPSADVSRLRVLIVDDHFVVRAGLKAMINSCPDFIVAGEATNGQQAIESFATLTPDVVLMDLHMPVMDGTAAIRAICKASPSARILVITVLAGDEDVFRALEAGALGYVLKDADSAVLSQAIRSAAEGKRWLPRNVSDKLTDRRKFTDLTRRETEVLELLRTGQTNKEIAVSLHITEFTAKDHIKSILAKLHARDRTEALAVALRRGLVRL